MEIKDITEFVCQQYEYIKRNEVDHLTVARERVYPVTDPDTASLIEVDSQEGLTWFDHANQFL